MDKSDNTISTARTAAPPAATNPELEMLRVTEAMLRQETPKNAGATLVNRLAEVVYADRVVLVELGRRATLLNVSGGGVVDQDSHFSDAVNLLTQRLKSQEQGAVVPVEPEEGEQQLRKVQSAMRGTQVLWLPLPFSVHAGTSQIRYALWLERWRGRQWSESDMKLLDRGALLFAQGLRPHVGRLRQKLPSAVVFGVILAVFTGVMQIPITSSVTAPAQVVAADPVYVFAPLEGVLKTLEVRPGQRVKEGDILFRYDARVLDRSIDEAVRAVAVARAELDRLEGAAFRDGEARAKLPVQKLQVERAEAEAAFYMSQRERADVKATSAGVVVLDDPDALIGAPLQQGQLVFSVADPDKTRLRMMTPASDAGLLELDARVELRLDRDPLHSIPAKVTRIGYDIVLSEDQVASITTDGAWDGEIRKQVAPGQRGTAKIYSVAQPLWKQIFRKPLISLRQFTGL